MLERFLILICIVASFTVKAETFVGGIVMDREAEEFPWDDNFLRDEERPDRSIKGMGLVCEQMSSEGNCLRFSFSKAYIASGPLDRNKDKLSHLTFNYQGLVSFFDFIMGTVREEANSMLPTEKESKLVSEILIHLIKKENRGKVLLVNPGILRKIFLILPKAPWELTTPFCFNQVGTSSWYYFTHFYKMNNCFIQIKKTNTIYRSAPGTSMLISFSSPVTFFFQNKGELNYSIKLLGEIGLVRE